MSKHAACVNNNCWKQLVYFYFRIAALFIIKYNYQVWNKLDLSKFTSDKMFTAAWNALSYMFGEEGENDGTPMDGNFVAVL